MCTSTWMATQDWFCYKNCTWQRKYLYLGTKKKIYTPPSKDATWGFLSEKSGSPLGGEFAVRGGGDWKVIPLILHIKTQRKVVPLFRDFLWCFTPLLWRCLQNAISLFLFGFCRVWNSMLNKSFHFSVVQKTTGVCLFPTIFTYFFKNWLFSN